MTKSPQASSKREPRGWRRWLRTWAFYRVTIGEWLKEKSTRFWALRLRIRNAQRRLRRLQGLQVRPVYDTLEARLVPALLTPTSTMLDPGVPLHSTGDSPMGFTAHVRSNQGQVTDGGIVELRDSDDGDRVVSRNALVGGSVGFYVTDPSALSHNLYAAYIGDEPAQFAASASWTRPDAGPGDTPSALVNRQLPMRFEANEGQIDASVRFVSHGSGYDLYLTNSEAVLALPVSRASNLNGQDAGSGGADSGTTDQAVDAEPQGADIVRLQWVGSNPDAKAQGLDRLETRSNYFIGNDASQWHTDIANYARVSYSGVYPGIDLVYYGNESLRQLEYDFNVAPGADPSVIRLRMEGAEGVQVDQEGNLVVTTLHGSFTQHAPLVYQHGSRGRTIVTSGYRIEQDGAIGFDLGDYDASLPLIVDPVLAYGNFLGGAASDQANAVAVDGMGNAYVVGQTASSTFPTVGAYASSYAGSTDAFVAKYNAAGDQLLYATYLGGTSSDIARGVAVDAAGNIYVVGQTSSGNFPTSLAKQSTSGGGQDAFVTKLDPTGSLPLFSTYLGGASTDTANGVAIDASGAAVVVGTTSSSAFPTASAVQGTYGGSQDAFVTKYSVDGSDFKFSTFVGGSSTDAGNGVAIDPAGGIFLGGSTSSTNFPGSKTVQTSNGGGQDGWVGKLVADGSSFTYTTYLGAAGTDTVLAIAVDNTGNAYAAGSTTSTAFPTMASAFQSTYGGNQDGFVTKINAAGTAKLYSTYLGGNDQDAINAIAIDSSGNANVAGMAASTNFPSAPTQAATNAAVFAYEFNSTGSSLLYSTYLNGTSIDSARGIALDASGNAVVVGSTSSSNFPISNSLQAYGGSDDAFVLKVGAPATPRLTSISTDSGASNTDFITSDTTLTLNGTAYASSTVTIYRAGAGQLGTATADGSGNWSYNYGTTLPEGVAAFTFTSTSGGLTGDLSKPYQVTVDTTAPTVSLTTATATYDLQPQVIVTAWDAGGVSSVADVIIDVDINNDGDFSDDFTGDLISDETNYQTTAMVGGIGDFFLISRTLIAAGSTIKVRARVADLAGNIGSSSTVTVVVSSSSSSTYADITAKPENFDPSGFQDQFGIPTTTVHLDLDNSPVTQPCCSADMTFRPTYSRPVVQVAITLPNDAAPLPANYSVRLKWGTTWQTAQTYSTSSFHKGQTLVVAQRADTAVGDTKRYDYELEITPAGGVATSKVGSMFVLGIDARVKPLGLAGWSLSTADRLIPITSGTAGVLRVSGTGDLSFYPSAGSGYTSPSGDFGTMTYDNTVSEFTYMSPTGDEWKFDSAGKQKWCKLCGVKTTIAYFNTTLTYLQEVISTITAPDGTLTEFIYDGSGQLEAIRTTDRNSNLRTTTVTVSGGNITGITDPTNAGRAMVYDNGRITSDTIGSTSTALTYTAEGALSSWTRGTGSEASTLTFTSNVAQGLGGTFAAGPLWASATGSNNYFERTLRDSGGRLLEQRSSDGGNTTYARDPANGLVTAAVDPLGRNTAFAYTFADPVKRDRHPLSLQITQPGGATQTLEYDTTAFHSLKTFTDERGKITTYAYDATTGFVTEQTQSLGLTPVVTAYTYAAPGLIETVTDPIGRVTTNLYDSRRLTGVQFVDGSSESYQYDDNGNLATFVDARGNTFTYSNDALGRATSWIDGEGKTGSAAYDAQGLLTQSTDALGVKTDYLYNSLGQLSKVTQGAGTALARVLQKNAYDSLGRLTSQRDARGFTTSFRYDSRGQLVGTTDANGGTTRQVFDWAGQLVQSIDALGFTTKYTYNSRGWLSTTTDAAGGITTNQYDAAGNLTTVTDARGNNWTTSYDDLGRVQGRSDPLSHPNSYSYDKAGNITATVDALGKTTTTAYNFVNRTIAVTNPNSHTTTTTLDVNGNVTAVQDARGNTATTVYDKNNRVTRSIDFRNKTTTLTLDNAGNVTVSVDPNGITTTIVRDAMGRQTGFTDGRNKTSTQLLNAHDQVVASTDRDGHTRYSSYDALGRLIGSRDALGNLSQSVYDANGNLIKAIDPLGNATKYEYDALNRLTKTTDAAGNATQIAYDAVGNVTVQTDALSKKTTSVYDAANRLTSVQTPAGTTTYAYNNRDQLTAVTVITSVVYPFGVTTTYAYDNAGYQTNVTFADSTSVVYAYDPNGNRTSVTDANGNVTTFTFNANNQVATQVDPFSKTTTYEYDNGGRTTGIVDRIGRRREFTYDAADRMTQEVWKVNATATVNTTLTYAFSDGGNLTSASSNVNSSANTYTLNYDLGDRVTYVSEPFGKSLTFAYDAAGNRTLVQDSGNGTVTSTYNNLNLLSSRQISVTGGATLRADFAYTARHQLGTLTRYDTLTTGTKVGETAYVYDDAMRVSSITHKNGSGTTLASFVYVYDAASRLSTETIGGTTTTYSYDTTDQLTGDGTNTWGYDDNGNRDTGGSTPTTGNRLTSDGTYTYAYDDESNVITKTDGSGNHWDYVYDQRNQMTQAKYTNSGGTVVQTNDYTYGPFGERLKVVHTETGNDFTRKFAYDAWNPAKQGGVGNEAFDIWADLDGTDTITTRYFDGDNVDGKLARAVGSAEQWLLGDKLGSIRNIANSSGTLVNTVAYDAWGKVLSQTGSGSNDVGRYAFTGREREVETGLQYSRARYYDPTTGRWQTQDPMGFDAGDSNLNRYVKNAPTNYGDPSGLFVWVAAAPVVAPWVIEGGVIVLAGLGIGVGIAAGGGNIGGGGDALDPGWVRGQWNREAIDRQQACRPEPEAPAVDSGPPDLSGSAIGGSYGPDDADWPDNWGQWDPNLPGDWDPPPGPNQPGQQPQPATGGGGQQPPRQPPQAPPGSPGNFDESFDDPADAIGDLNGTAEYDSHGPTRNDQIRNWGYTVTYYFRDSNGVKHTVFYNPATGQFGGAHPSSGQ